MISLKIKPEKSEKPSDSAAMPSPSLQRDEYPYGLRITISGADLIRKLNLKGASVKDLVTIQCEARVKRVSDTEYEDGGNKVKQDATVELQIERMDPVDEDSSDLDREFDRADEE